MLKCLKSLLLALLLFFAAAQLTAAQVFVSGGFDDLRARDLRFLEEASKWGELTVFLWPDEMIESRTGKPSKFPLEERLYLLNAVRYVSHVAIGPDLPLGQPFAIWVDRESSENDVRRALAAENHIAYCIVPEEELDIFPPVPPNRLDLTGYRKKVIATGCFDWFHSGHVRFLEECAAYGDLYVVVGNDPNIRLLKGEGHPLLFERERFYAINSFKFQKQTLMSPGRGYLESDSIIRELKPDIFVVNEDGDKGGKQEYCRELGIEYIVLKRLPAQGLPVRSSTGLRGF